MLRYDTSEHNKQNDRTGNAHAFSATSIAYKHATRTATILLARQSHIQHVPTEAPGTVRHGQTATQHCNAETREQQATDITTRKSDLIAATEESDAEHAGTRQSACAKGRGAPK